MTPQQSKCLQQSVDITLSSSKRFSLSPLPSTSGLPHLHIPGASRPALFHIKSSPSCVEIPIVSNASRHRRDSEIVAQVLNKTFTESTTGAGKSETEQELDALEIMVRPKGLRRGSVCLLPTVLLPEEDPKPEKSCVWLDISQDLDFIRRRKEALAPKRYINLPKLPFGKHSSYNEETDIRAKIVSKRWKAWKREEKPKSLHKYSM